MDDQAGHIRLSVKGEKGEKRSVKMKGEIFRATAPTKKLRQGGFRDGRHILLGEFISAEGDVLLRIEKPFKTLASPFD